MNNIEYVNGALRTEAPIDSALVSRLHHLGAIMELKLALSAGIKAGTRIDNLKRYLFYGDHQRVNLPACSFIPPRVFERLSDPGVIRLLHAAMGMLTEAGELMQALHAHITDGTKLDTINLIEEGGDNFWYMAILADTLSVTFEDMMTRNHRKLRARYPERFVVGQALTRDLGLERQALEEE